MSAGVYSNVSMVMSFFFALVIALVMLTLLKMTLRDSSNMKRYRRSRPNVGVVGILTTLDSGRWEVISEGILGRSRRADIRVKSKGIFRKHLYFRYSDGVLKLTGRRGTFVYDSKETDRAAVRPGEEFTVGNVTFTFIIPRVNAEGEDELFSFGDDRRARRKKEKLRALINRSNADFLLALTLIFEFTAPLLLTFACGKITMEALLLAFALPVGSYLFQKLASNVFKADRAIAVTVALLVSIGIITLQSISMHAEQTGLRQYRYLVGEAQSQGVFAIAGAFAFMAGAAFIRKIRIKLNYVPALMLLCLLALLTPYALGREINGARNWISLAGVSLQPSEFVKPALIVILALSFSGAPNRRRYFTAVAFSACCCFILLMQRDLGAVFLYFILTIGVYFAASGNGLIALAGLGAGAGAGYIAYSRLDYVKRRFEIWKNPWSDPLDKGYQLVQSLTAIGSGGLFGMGLGLGAPHVIPLSNSDFIFAALAEQYGLIFTASLLAIYALIAMRGLVIAMNSTDKYMSLTAFGVVTLMSAQTMLIVGGNTQLLPLTGVTLPFVSVGGSSLVSMMFAAGMLCGISGVNFENYTRDIENDAGKYEYGIPETKNETPGEDPAAEESGGVEPEGEEETGEENEAPDVRTT